MIHIRHIYLLLFILIAGVSCKPKHHIQIQDYYYSDSLSYKERNANYHIGLVSEVGISLLSTTSDDPNEERVVKNINNFIINEINNKYKDESADSIVCHIAKENMELLMSNLLEKDDSEDDSISESISLYNDYELSDTLYNRIRSTCYFGLNDTILCLKITSASYTGGAHPGKETYCYSFSLNDGSIIRHSRIMMKNSSDDLLNRIKQKLMKMKHFKNEEELESNGFKEITISPYILLDKDSLCFFYESYSIAPFCEGDINVKFSYDELKDITLIDR